MEEDRWKWSYLMFQYFRTILSIIFYNSLICLSFVIEIFTSRLFQGLNITDLYLGWHSCFLDIKKTQEDRAASMAKRNSGLKIQNFLPWDCSSNLIKPAKGFLSLLSNFQTLFSINQLLCAFFGLQGVFLASNSLHEVRGQKKIMPMFNLIEF